MRIAYLVSQYPAFNHTFVLRDYGHSLNLAPDAPQYHAAVIAWADSVIGH